MNPALADPGLLEPIAARAWPAAEVRCVGGWRLHASAGYSGRINACWPITPPGMPLDEAIGAVQAWYATRRLPSLFKIVDGATHSQGLTERLATLGYRPRTTTVMMIARAQGGADLDVSLSAELDSGFEAVFAAAGADDPSDSRERLEALSRMGRPRAFARLEAGGAPAAIGACAVEGEWAGIFAMRTVERCRRLGFATRILGALTDWARISGAPRVYLQVEADNPAAVALYRNAGFEAAYQYRYWARPGGL
jgi:GNAT superfamily N-acetyltransferase